MNDISSNKNTNSQGCGSWALSAGDIVYIRWPYAAPTLPLVGGEVTLSIITEVNNQSDGPTIRYIKNNKTWRLTVAKLTFSTFAEKALRPYS